MRIAHIYKGKIQEIFTADEIPDWPPYLNGEKPLLIDVTNRDAEENYLYNVETDTIISDLDEIQRHNIISTVQNIKETQLTILKSKEYQLKMLFDPEFAERARLSIHEWENIENQEGYPDDIDWPEMWEEIPE